LTTRKLLELMQTPEDIIDGSYNYIVVIFAGIIAPVFFNLFSSILRSLGDSKTPLIFLIIASVINIILDFVFILAFSSGVAGAAYATVIAQMLSGIFCMVYSLKRFPILRLRREDWKFSWRFAWTHLRIALPMAFQFSVTAIGVMIIQTALNKLGSTAVAAYTAASKIDQLATQPLVSFGVAMATYSAQNYGAGNIERIKTGVKSCCVISVIAGLIGAFIVITLCRRLVYLFVGGGQEDVFELVRKYIIINSGMYVFLGILFVFRNVLQGVGISSIPFMAGVFELITRSLVAFIFVGKLGFTALCLASPLAWIVADIPLIIMYIVFISRQKKRILT
ncbi:MAG: MATE family efflux transporter, partial [Oscillospiraceae bacterium]|nr:MATE family efflux transporter [Oscillospiraceae bacterium]